MAKIYDEKSEELQKLLDKAGSEGAATLLIPDLQRPYVWSPTQVTRLIDSLIRGWPFGTLLLWQVHHDDLATIPHRTFWKEVDRTGTGDGSTVSHDNPPGEFQMVLDGQQRVQSLLLALVGDGWGFKLPDRGWSLELTERGQPTKYAKHYWSMGSLCLDLKIFLEEYARTNNHLHEVDYEKVLKWVVTDPANGLSKERKPEKAGPAIERAYEPQHKGRFLRLSRLWRATPANTNLKEKEFRNFSRDLLKQHDVPDTNIEQALEPMAELMSTLRDIKLLKVAYLEVVRFDPQVWTQDAYNDAVVNIFTRLNSAGLILKREEITFAWLKVGWDLAKTNNKSAVECFAELRKNLADSEVSLPLNDLVSGVSLVWSIGFNGGSILTNKDLLRGDTIRPMAKHLATNWKLFESSIETATDAVTNRKLVYMTHYLSLNALAFLWGWRYLAEQWFQNNPLKVTEADSYRKRIDAIFADYCDRWLICSNWAREWAGASAEAVAGYAKQLAEDHIALQQVSAPVKALELLEARLKGWVMNLEQPAVVEIEGLEVQSREQVHAYYTPLWLWHRLDETRWEMSRIQLRDSLKKKVKLEVDHIVPVKLWREKQPLLAAGEQDNSETKVNVLGNCFLLEKSFNIVKSGRSLGSFLGQIENFKKDGDPRVQKVDINIWAEAMALEQKHITSNQSDCEELKAAFETRTHKIKADLIEFVRGERSRADLD